MIYTSCLANDNEAFLDDYVKHMTSFNPQICRFKACIYIMSNLKVKHLLLFISEAWFLSCSDSLSCTKIKMA